jgi:DNA-binding IclR family transcriptional regulator
MAEDKNWVQSISRGLSVLQAVSENPSPPRLSDLARQLKLSISTLQRFTHTLQKLGYVDRDVETKRFRPGTKLIALGISATRRIDFRNVAFPLMQKTARETGETVNLAILDYGLEIMYIERIKTEQILSINLQIGSIIPAFCTSMGKAILSYLPEERLDEFFEKVELIPFTSNTIIQKEDLRKELQKVRIRGFAVNNEEFSKGVRSVAAPVRNFEGKVIAAVNIAVPSARVDVKILETILARKVVELANQISRALSSLEFKGPAEIRRDN